MADMLTTDTLIARRAYIAPQREAGCDIKRIPSEHIRPDTEADAYERVFGKGAFTPQPAAIYEAVQCGVLERGRAVFGTDTDTAVGTDLVLRIASHARHAADIVLP